MAVPELQYQKNNFSANSIVQLAFNVDAICPPDAVSMVVVGEAKVGLLVMLKNSARNCSAFVSVNLKLLGDREIELHQTIGAQDISSRASISVLGRHAEHARSARSL